MLAARRSPDLLPYHTSRALTALRRWRGCHAPDLGPHTPLDPHVPMIDEASIRARLPTIDVARYMVGTSR